MVFQNLINKEIVMSALIGSTLGAIIIASIFLALVLILAIYIYFSYAWMTIARKLKYKNAWLAWIPIANISMMLELGGFHWAWVFLILVPVAGWVALFILLIIATWKIFEKRNYHGWFSLSMIIPKLGMILYLIVIGFVAWNDKGKGTKETKEIEKEVKRAKVKRKAERYSEKHN